MNVTVTIEPRDAGWVAFFRGKGSPILRPVPDNARPATAAWWRRREDAIAELPELLGCSVTVLVRA